MIELSKNTNPFSPSKKTVKKLKREVENIKHYSSDYVKVSDDYLYKKYHIKKENIVLTNGTMEAMDLILRTLNKKKIGMFSPTFWGIKKAAQINSYNVLEKKLDISDSYDAKEIAKLANKSDVVYICNANNPTLNYIDSKELIRIIKDNSKCHFIIDETELLFNVDYSKKSILKSINKVDNLSVLISLSKIFGICGIRAGLLISSSKNCPKFESMKMPYSTNIIAERFISLLKNEEKNLDNAKLKIKQNFNYLIRRLNTNVIKRTIYNEMAFILLELNDNIDYDDFVKYLVEKNIIISPTNNFYKLTGKYIRVSSGKKNDYKKLIKAINNYDGGNVCKKYI